MACSRHNVIVHGKSANLLSRTGLFYISQLVSVAFVPPWVSLRVRKPAARQDLTASPIVAFPSIKPPNITIPIDRSGPWG